MPLSDKKFSENQSNENYFVCGHEQNSARIFYIFIPTPKKFGIRDAHKNLRNDDKFRKIRRGKNHTSFVGVSVFLSMTSTRIFLLW
jgi:hypothetical protein